MVASVTLAEAFDAWERGDETTSRAIVRRLLRQTPKLAGAHYLSGLLHLDRGESGKAVQAFRRALVHGPDSPALRLALGRAYALGTAWGQAEENFRRALSLAPDLPAGLWSLSDLLFHRDRPAEALPLLAVLTRSQPQNPLPWERIGLLQRRLGNLPEALEAFDKVLELEPDLPRAYANRAALLLDLGRVTEALDGLSEARARYPEEPGLIRNQALALVKAGRAAAALPLYEKLLTQFPKTGFDQEDLSQAYAEALIQADRARDAVTLRCV